jgi:hypothetical protein
MAVAAFDAFGDTRRARQQVFPRFFRSYKMFRHNDLNVEAISLPKEVKHEGPLYFHPAYPVHPV